MDKVYKVCSVFGKDNYGSLYINSSPFRQQYEIGKKTRGWSGTPVLAFATLQDALRNKPVTGVVFECSYRPYLTSDVLSKYFEHFKSAWQNKEFWEEENVKVAWAGFKDCARIRDYLLNVNFPWGTIVCEWIIPRRLLAKDYE